MPASYKNLWTYRFSLIIHDFTVKFCQRWVLSKYSHLGRPDYRTADQMIQAARSGKQNISEGSSAMRTSMKSALVLTNVAKSSLEELIEDYEDFLRQRDLSIWDKDNSKVRAIRQKYGLIVRNLDTLSDIRNLDLHPLPEIAANGILTLCHQCTYLLDKQIKTLEKKHQQEGGYSEKLYRNRLEFRSKNSNK